MLWYWYQMCMLFQDNMEDFPYFTKGFTASIREDLLKKYGEN